MTTVLPRAVPRDGLANPVFENMGWDEDLIVSLTFSPSLTDQQIWKIRNWLRGLGGSRDHGDPCAREDPFVHEWSFFARVGNLADPRGAVLSLINDLAASGAKIRDSFFSCWERRDNGVMGPRHDPRAPQECIGCVDSAEYMDRLWNENMAPPANEREQDLTGGIIVMDELILECRGSRLYFPEARIGYGLLPFVLDDNTANANPDAGTNACANALAGVQVQVEAQRRTDEVRGALITAVEKGWETLFKAPGRGHLRPMPLDSQGHVDKIDRIRCRERIGYHFSVAAVELLDRPAPHRCRFREYELMEAVIEAVRECGLAPVITWQRQGTPIVLPPIKQPETVEVQIWERESDPGSR